MKRDMNLIRDILLQIADTSSVDLDRLNTDKDTFDEHFRLIEEGGLLEWFKMGILSHVRLSPSGRDFIEKARNAAVWRKAMQAAGERSFGVLLGVLNELTARKVTMKV